MLGKYWLWALVLVFIVGTAIAAWTYRRDFAYAYIATGYAAKQTCSCLHVSGQPLESCLADFPQEARERLTVDAEGQEVRASVLLGAISARAVYEPEFGCTIVD